MYHTVILRFSTFGRTMECCGSTHQSPTTGSDVVHMTRVTALSGRVAMPHNWPKKTTMERQTVGVQQKETYITHLSIEFLGVGSY